MRVLDKVVVILRASIAPDFSKVSWRVALRKEFELPTKSSLITGQVKAYNSMFLRADERIWIQVQTEVEVLTFSENKTIISRV